MVTATKSAVAAFSCPKSRLKPSPVLKEPSESSRIFWARVPHRAEIWAVSGESWRLWKGLRATEGPKRGPGCRRRDASRLIFFWFN
ncbi:hypothetical protein MTP99_009862 [Tenebrio molitor]|nr:hypothetical protein MTP99_009862 [Tenebrio molitor]